ncbi:MAG: alpha/beta fold hydrolase [Armatimonadota bacterium]|nr:alpha/beta fold hydrolase [Armatimonadota bacterium]MDR7533818.1 alpha/beta fold hydrolase [Armatimonadota bacterium]MDR7536653.1 alpha/beta fold hydrolase [Armatimonadota bacterium]
MTPDRYVDVRGVPLRYRQQGGGPPVLLLHGVGASLEFWDWTTPALQDAFTTLAVDLPGFGRSAFTPEVLSPEGFVRIVWGFLDAVGVGRAALVGSSLGGAIAVLAAGSAPERVWALALAAPGGFGREVGLWLRLATVPGLGEVLVALARRAPQVALRHTFADPRRIPAALLASMRWHATRPEPGRAYLQIVRHVLGLRGVRPAMVAVVRAAATRVDAPTLVVWGARDRVVPPAHADAVAASIPQAQVRLLEDCGHLPLVEAADAFTGLLVAFLRDAAAGRATAHAGVDPARRAQAR